MPTGNAGITQGLALRLTNMEQGRREVTANALARERMDAIAQQREAAMRYRQAEAERKAAERQQKQLDDLSKNINILGKDLDPVFIGKQQRETTEFLNRTLNGMQKNPNYTSSPEYHADMGKVLANLNMRLYSSKNLQLADKKVATNADDWEYNTDKQTAREKVDYEAFVQANGGTDFVGVDAIVQPKFNREKVYDAMLKHSTDSQPIANTVRKLDHGVLRVEDTKKVDDALLGDIRDEYMRIIGNSGMNDADFMKQSQQIDEVYNSLKGRVLTVGGKTYAPPPQRVGRTKVDAATKVTKTGKTTKHESKDAIVTENEAPSGVILTYQSTAQNTTMPPITIPQGALVEGVDHKWRNPNATDENSWRMTNPQYHIITKGAQKGSMVLYGTVIDKFNTNLGMMRWKMPTDEQNAVNVVNQINGVTKNKMQFNYENGEYTYSINDGVVLGKTTAGGQPANTQPTPPSGGGQNTQNAPATKKKGKRMKWNSVTHKMEAY